MRAATSIKLIRPHGKQHKQYLCILKLYTAHKIQWIVSLLNRRFSDYLDKHSARFDEAMTEAYYESMERNDHRELRWAEKEGRNSRKVRRVLEWAREQEID